MRKSTIPDEMKEKAYEMYWTDRKEVKLGQKPGRYSLREIAEETGMHKTYVSKIARGKQ